MPGPGAAVATHPLAAEDARTLGRGEQQVELAIGHSRDRRASGGTAVREDSTQVDATLTLGVRDDLDLSIGAGSVWAAVRAGGAVSVERRPGDLGLHVKWRALEHGGLTLAVKPGLAVAADDPGGLVAGRAAWSVAVVATKEVAFLALDLEGTWERDGRAAAEDLRPDRRRVSLAARAGDARRLLLVAEAAAETRGRQRIGPARPRPVSAWSGPWRA